MSTEDLDYCSIDYLETELASLRPQPERDENQIEANKQELHNIQFSIIRISALQLEYNEQIEFMANEEDPDCKKLTAAIQATKDHKRILQGNYNDKFNSLQQALASTNEDIVNCEEQLKLLKQVALNETQNIDSENTKENIDEEIVRVLEEIEELQLQIDKKTKENQGLQLKIKEEQEEITCLEDTIQYTNEELQNIKESIGELQAEISLVQAEKQSKTSKPLDDESRGNSLFAEVHDRKNHLDYKLKFMKSHYIEMQSGNADLTNQIKALAAENMRLSETYMLGLKEEKELENNFLQYQEQIGILKTKYMETRALLKEQSKCQNKDSCNDEMRVLKQFLTSTENDFLNRLDNLLSTWECQVELAKKLDEVNSAVRNIQFELDQLTSRKTQLEAERNALCFTKNINHKCECKKTSKKSTKLAVFKFK